MCHRALVVPVAAARTVPYGTQSSNRSLRHPIVAHARTHTASHSPTHPLTHSRTHASTQPPTHPPTCSFTHPLTHSPTHPHSNTLTDPLSPQHMHGTSKIRFQHGYKHPTDTSPQHFSHSPSNISVRAADRCRPFCGRPAGPMGFQYEYPTGYRP